MTKSYHFSKVFFLCVATAANQLEGGKGLSLADVMPGGKVRYKLITSPGFDFEMNLEKYSYPNHDGIDFFHRYAKRY
ncbi:hypothetical protein HPK19_25560 (plasmid) [Arthrobacter citreus]|nr:hypothetical protein HPK19_25560 [Arthrobacter citreus]